MPSLSLQDQAVLNDQSLDHLYAQLGRATDPVVSDVTLGEQNLHALIGEERLFALKNDARAGVLAWPSWIDRGLEYFENVWTTIGSTVCSFYHDYNTIDSDWIEKLAQAIVGLINVGWGIAVIIVQIALKRGLNELCPT